MPLTGHAADTVGCPHSLCPHCHWADMFRLPDGFRGEAPLLQLHVLPGPHQSRSSVRNGQSWEPGGGDASPAGCLRRGASLLRPARGSNRPACRVSSCPDVRRAALAITGGSEDKADTLLGNDLLEKDEVPCGCEAARKAPSGRAAVEQSPQVRLRAGRTGPGLPGEAGRSRRRPGGGGVPRAPHAGERPRRTHGGRGGGARARGPRLAPHGRLGDPRPDSSINFYFSDN